MPTSLFARPPRDAVEERQIRKLAGARHAPGDWIQRAQIVALSWDGTRGPAIAAPLGCHPETVRRRVHRFNADGLDGLGDRLGAGRRPRITPAERSQIIAPATTPPPAPGWPVDGHRITAEADYCRGPEKTGGYGALRVADGTALPMTAATRIATAQLNQPAPQCK
jgi:Homeodomain-like domain